MTINDYMEGVFFYVGILVNGTLLFLSIWGVYSFYPRKDVRGNHAAAWLILAIWLGFLSVGTNVAYWRLFGDLNIRFGWVERETVSYVGRIGDFFWKGSSALAIYLHFFARWKSISSDDQKTWTPLLMGFYPNIDKWAVQMTIRMKAKLRIKSQK